MFVYCEMLVNKCGVLLKLFIKKIEFSHSGLKDFDMLMHGSIFPFYFLDSLIYG